MGHLDEVPAGQAADCLPALAAGEVGDKISAPTTWTRDCPRGQCSRKRTVVIKEAIILYLGSCRGVVDSEVSPNEVGVGES